MPTLLLPVSDGGYAAIVSTPLLMLAPPLLLTVGRPCLQTRGVEMEAISPSPQLGVTAE